MGWKSFSFIGLLMLGTGQTLDTFQLSGSISLSIYELIIFTIGEVVSSATGLMNSTGVLSKLLAKTFLSSGVNLFTSVNVLRFMINALSDSCSGIMVASFVWSNATFSLFINLVANSVKYSLSLLGSWMIHFFVASIIQWTVSHTSFGFWKLGALRRKEAFFDLIVFYNNFLQFGSSGKQLG